MKSKTLLLLSLLALTPILEITAVRGGGGRVGGGRGGFAGGRGFAAGGRGVSSVSRGFAGSNVARTTPVRRSGASMGRIARPSTGLRPRTRPSTRPVNSLTRYRGGPRAGHGHFDRGVNRQFWNNGFRGRGWGYWFHNYFPFAIGVFPFLYYAQYGSYPDVYYDYYNQYGEYPQPIENYDQYASGALPWPTEGYEEEAVEQPAYEEVVSYEDDGDGDITGPQMIFVS